MATDGTTWAAALIIIILAHRNVSAYLIPWAHNNTSKNSDDAFKKFSLTFSRKPTLILKTGK